MFDSNFSLFSSDRETVVARFALSQNSSTINVLVQTTEIPCGRPKEFLVVTERDIDECVSLDNMHMYMQMPVIVDGQKTMAYFLGYSKDSRPFEWLSQLNRLFRDKRTDDELIRLAEDELSSEPDEDPNEEQI